MDGFVTIERVDHEDAIDPDRIGQATKLAVNLRVGQELVFRASGQVVRLVLEQKHGQGARVVVHAPRTVEIERPT